MVGLRVMVAPITSAAGPIGSSGADKPPSWTLRECLGETSEKVALALDLLAIVRRILSSRGLSELQIDSHVKKLGSPKR